VYTTPLFSQEEIEIIIKHTGKDSSKMVFKTSSISFTLIVSLYMHLRFVIGQESLNIPSNVQPEFTIANSVLQKATLDKIDRIKKLRDKHQSVASEHPDMKKEIRLDAELGGLREFYDDLMAEIHSLRGQLQLCSLNSGSPGNLPQDCWEAYEMGFHKSGRYTIQPRYWGAIQVYCDMETDGGGWTVFQRRFNGELDFYRYWLEYKNGFGNITSEFYLGMDNIFYLSNQKVYSLRIDFEEWDEKKYFALYEAFAINNECDSYRLRLGEYRDGNAGDSFRYNGKDEMHDGMKFSTKDSDNDIDAVGSSSTRYHGAWWYRLTSWKQSNLNGKYYNGTSDRRAYIDGVYWRTISQNHSLKKTEMKLRPQSARPSGAKPLPPKAQPTERSAG